MNPNKNTVKSLYVLKFSSSRKNLLQIQFPSFHNVLFTTFKTRVIISMVELHKSCQLFKTGVHHFLVKLYNSGNICIFERCTPIKTEYFSS